jgi:prepilin-type N-terminal cleavage/methylation domain-containing protein
MAMAPPDGRGRKAQRPDGQAGFTLIEVVMAVVILGLAYVAVLQNFSFSLENILRIEDSKRQTLAASLKFDELLRVSGKEEVSLNASYPTYLEGSTYKLVLVAGDDNEFVTLKLVRQ